MDEKLTEYEDEALLLVKAYPKKYHRIEEIIKDLRSVYMDAYLARGLDARRTSQGDIGLTAAREAVEGLLEKSLIKIEEDPRFYFKRDK
ncbi:MAG TPA: hypothetical protein ENH46_03060, partial [Candidatus Pacearchaeota archaeon]|nr:hypothetical protein [Candidatus Pacearchaeota archaeon]